MCMYVQMFGKEWFLKRYHDLINEMIKQPYPQSDLEYVMNWRYEVWNDADITVAFGEGLFTHHEIGEHGALNFDGMRAVRCTVCVCNVTVLTMVMMY